VTYGACIVPSRKGTRSREGRRTASEWRRLGHGAQRDDRLRHGEDRRPCARRVFVAGSAAIAEAGNQTAQVPQWDRELWDSKRSWYHATNCILPENTVQVTATLPLGRGRLSALGRDELPCPSEAMRRVLLRRMIAISSEDSSTGSIGRNTNWTQIAVLTNGWSIAS
jgi:hypothetical protein